MLKKLVTGQLSLPMTFWGWGFCGALVLGLLGLAGVHTGHAAMVPLSYIFKVILFGIIRDYVFSTPENHGVWRAGVYYCPGAIGA